MVHLRHRLGQGASCAVFVLAISGCGSAPAASESEVIAEEPTIGTAGLGLVTVPSATHWWSFDEYCASSDQVLDTTNVYSGATGTKLNGAGCGLGKLGGGVSLDGDNDVVSVPDRASLHFTNAFTLSAWVYPTNTPGHIAGKWTQKKSYQLAMSSGKFTFSIGRGTSPTVVTVQAAAPLNTWSHVAGVYNGSRLSIYVNGVLKASTATSGSVVDSSNAFTIGNLPGSAGTGFKGRIDEVKAFNTALPAADVDRLANGLAHRRLRAIVIDPKLDDGRYLHEHMSAEGWRNPEEVYNWWLRFLNDAAGEPQLYLPEDGTATAALKFVDRVPWNNGRGGCPMQRGSMPILQTGQQYLDHGRNPPVVGGTTLDSDPYALFDPSVVGFDLVKDANEQRFDELVVIVPDSWGIGGEGMMVANSTDNTAYPAHDALMRQPALRSDRKFFVHGVHFVRDDNNLEQFWHRTEAALAHAFSDVAPPSVAEAPCGGPGRWGPGVQTAFDLWTSIDRDHPGEAHLGTAHHMPNSEVGYERGHADVVPSNHTVWASFPAGFPLDLTAKSRRSRISCADWACDGPDVYPRSMIWQLSKLPKGDGKWDQRWANWWKYVSDANVQDGRGLPATSPVKGPFHGAMDLTLTLRADGVELAWQAEASGLGTYAVRRSTDRASWTTVASGLSGTTTRHLVPRPPAGVATFYQVLWSYGGTTRYSDLLGAKVGTRSGARPPIDPSIALYQLNVPYVRWHLPTQCSDLVPCTAEHGLGCDDTGLCRQGLGTDDPASDYHPGAVTYTLKRGGNTVVATVGRKPGWDGQYNHVRFSGAETSVANGTVVEYLAEARDLDGVLLGTTDTVLAVPGQSTVGY